MARRLVIARNGYETATTDLAVYSPDEVMPDPSSVGLAGYPADFAALMPGYTGSGANIAGACVPQAEYGYGSGGWSTPEAYAWHSADNLTTNPQVGGFAGDVIGVPFAFGPVESGSVENFEMLGNQAVFQTPDVNNYGDVGFMDFGGRLASAVASDTFDIASFYDVTPDILRAV
jgi:hypothetical protein